MSADMPKPFGYWHEGQTYEESDFFLASEFGNVGCDRCTGLYTAEDLEKAKQEATRQAMEHCAEVCDDQEEPAWYGYENPNNFDDGKRACANAIRALLPHEEKRHG